ncbi:hypothetical protein AMECASPLE_029124 [Ameca splendens]|uniref:Uncharacterized protein n=1 Tax=Ameca splendens TaxID=208324 RepID=A0ABV0Z3H7_9TELE
MSSLTTQLTTLRDSFQDVLVLSVAVLHTGFPEGPLRSMASLQGTFSANAGLQATCSFIVSLLGPCSLVTCLPAIVLSSVPHRGQPPGCLPKLCASSGSQMNIDLDTD